MLIAGMYIYRHMVIIAFEKANRMNKLEKAVTALYISLTMAIISIFMNQFTHFFFYIDNNKQLIKGPLYQSEFLLLVIYAFIIIFTMKKETGRIDKTIKRSLFTGALAAISVITLQTIFPNGIFSALTVSNSLLIVLICAQQTQINVDSLTGFHNRTALLQTVNNKLLNNKQFILIIISVKNFKRINVRFGYLFGDVVLRYIGDFLLTLPYSSTPFRLLGADYAIILPPMSIDKYNDILHNITTKFNSPITINETTFSCSISTALLSSQECKTEMSDVILKFDYLLDAIKKQSKPLHISFSSDFIAHCERREYIIELLRTAIRNDLFTIVYQPIFELKSQSYVGAEALLRLLDQDNNYISPEEFIQIAEESGFISEIGTLVIEKVCHFLQLHPSYPFYISINISAIQFVEPSFFTIVKNILEKYNIKPHQLKLEITERTLLAENSDTFKILNDFKQLGVGIYLDDFGTGYSNLFSISQFSFECIKFDKSLINNLNKNSVAFDILCAFVEGVNKTKSYVLIEGVETYQQYNQLKNIGIDSIQGYLFTKPLQESDFIYNMIENIDDFNRRAKKLLSAIRLNCNF